MIVESHLAYGRSTNHPTRIVMHAMGEFIDDGDRPRHAVKFLDRYKLSAHSLVAPDGTNFRCRKDTEGAWHARGYNKNSLGMEWLVPGVHDYASFIAAMRQPYLSEEQYQEGLRQVREWCDLFPIRTIDRHSDLSPGRKADPGDGFPWGDFIHDLGAL